MATDDLIEKILERDSFRAFSNILDGGVLTDYQTRDVLMALAAKRHILRIDTGLGKTYEAAGIMKLVKRKNPDAKFIFLMKNNQLIQTPNDIRKLTGLKVITTDSTTDGIRRFLNNANFMKYDIWMITRECLNNNFFMRSLFQFKDKITGVIIDEAHTVCNYKTSNSGLMLKSFCRSMEYVIALTATPIVSSVSQMVMLMKIVNPNLTKSAWSLEHELSKNGISGYKSLLTSRTRQDLGIISNYVAEPIFVKPTEYQYDAHGGDMFLKTRCSGAYPQAKAVVDLVNKHKPGKGLVYVWRHEARDFLAEELGKAGIRYACINGETSIADKGSIQQDFIDNKYDVVLTSVTASLNLDSEYVIFYEYTLDFKQMIGRAERGFNPKTLHIYYIFTEDTGEVDYFRDKIYNRSELVRRVLNIDSFDILSIASKVGTGSDEGDLLLSHNLDTYNKKIQSITNKDDGDGGLFGIDICDDEPEIELDFLQ